MSNFNFRLYGEQIYNMLSGYFKDYISPEINKDQFLSMFKEGKLIYDNIQTKEKFNIYPQVIINNLNIQKICINIPDEKDNIKIYLRNASCDMIISNISEKKIKEILIKEKKSLIDSFIQTAINEIMNKAPSKSFFDSLLENLINQALNGINIAINNLKLNIKCNNKIFYFSINDFIFDANGKIIFNKISLYYEENLIKYNVVPNFDINILFKSNNYSESDNISNGSENTENKNRDSPNLLQVDMSNFSFELNQKIYFGIIELLNCFFDSSYRKIYYKYKTLIHFHRLNIINENEKKDYKKLWLYAIKTIIKLQKYVGYDKRYIFNLLNSTQEKIVKKYFKNIKDNNNDDLNNMNLLYINKLNLLKGTKEIVNEKVLEEKKGNVLSNAFSFFFGGGDEKKNELSEEEEECLNKIYRDEYLCNYLNDYDKINTDGIIFNKIKKFYDNLIIKIKIQKLELVLSNQNSAKKCDFYIQNIYMEFSHKFNSYNYNFFINDICINQSISIFKNKKGNSPMIKFIKDKNDINLTFGFNYIELNENDFIYLLSFLYSIETPTKTKLFKPEKEINLNDNKNINVSKNNNADIGYFLKNFRISNIPSLSLICEGNKIDIIFNDFLLTETYFCFTLSIRDSFGEILPDYTFMINTIKEGNIYRFHLNMPIKFTLSKKSSKFFFLLYLKLQKVKEENKIGFIIQEKTNIEDEKLFGFKYTSYIKLDIEDIRQIWLDFLIDKTEIEINEEKCKSLLLINNFSVRYENTPDYKDFEKLIQIKDNNKDNNGMISLLNMDSSNINNNNEGNCAIVESFDYINIIETLFDSFNMNLKEFSFIYEADNNITNLTIKNIKAEKQDKIFNISILKCDITLNILTPVKITSTISKNLVTGIIDAKIINPVIDINMQIIQALNESYKFLIDQINLDVILCKLIIEINNTKVNFNQFNYIIENINFKNFTEVTNDTMFVKIKNIIMRHKDIDIIKEKGIDIEYKFVSSTENLITFKSNDLNINITQSDIYYLVLSLKTKKENDINKDKDKESSLLLENNTTSTNFIENNFTPDFLNQINKNFKSDNNNFFDLNGDFFNMTNNSNDTNNNANNKDNNNNELIDFTLNTQNKNNDNNKDDNLINNTLVFNNGNTNSKNNGKINNKEKKKVFELKVKALIPCINLSLNINENSDNSSSNNYTKISEFSITSSSFEINSLTTSESGNETVSPLTEVDYQIYLGQLLLKYFDNDKNEIIMLNFEKGDKNNKKYKNQIEISYSKNEMIVRMKCLLI